MKIKIPTVLRTYGELAELEDMFTAKRDKLELIIVGRPGIGKTKGFTTALGREDSDYGYISGNSSAPQIFCDVWKSRNLPIVIDDVDTALADAATRSLLKGLMEHERPKTARWNKRTELTDEWGHGIPKTFTTVSNFAIILNEISDKTAVHLSAIISRAYVAKFDPTAKEVHTYVGDWFKDQDVYGFVAEHIKRLPFIDIRSDYVTASKLKAHGKDWKGWLLNIWKARGMR